MREFPKIKLVIDNIKHNGIKFTYYKLLNKIINKIIEIKYYKALNCISKDDMQLPGNSVKISIVVPIYNTPDDFLKEMIESVIKQTYSNWQLCIADGGESISNREIIENYLQKDSRIVYKKLGINGGIAYNTNEAIKLSDGDYVAFLDHDDVLTVDALEEVAKKIYFEQADIIYSDEDKMDEKGKKFFTPHIKPDWSPRTLRSYNYICHFTAVKKELITQYGGISEGYEGSQDYEFILRMCKYAQNIAHIPKILYHWRISGGSTAGNIYQKSYGLESSKKALEQLLKRENIEAKVLPGAYIGSNLIIRNCRSEEIINVVVYNDEFDIASLIKLKQDIIAQINYSYINIYFHNTLENVWIEETGQILDRQKVFDLMIQNNYTLVYKYGVKVLSKNIIDELLGEMNYTDSYIASPIIMYNSNKVRSLGLAYKDHSIIQIYKNSKVDLLGYMGRLQIPQNVFAVEPLLFMTQTIQFKDEILDRYSSSEKWIKLMDQALVQKKYIVVNPSIKVIYKKEINWETIYHNKKEKYLSVIKYM